MIDSANSYIPAVPLMACDEHHNKQNVEPGKLSTSWGHTKVLFTCY